MDPVKTICQQMARDDRIMTFSDMAHAAATGAAASKNNPVIGAVLGVSLEASKRAIHITEDLIRDIAQQGKRVLMEDNLPEAPTKTPPRKPREPRATGPKPRRRPH